MSFLQKIKYGLAKFFYGRHGMDQLNWAIVIFAFVLSMVSSAFSSSIVGTIIYLVYNVCWLVVLFRMLSKNNNKRYNENMKFLGHWMPIKDKISAFIARVKDKDHRYYKCSCGTYLRVPKGKGKIKITCSNCGKQMIKKS